MADKVASGAWHDGGPAAPHRPSDRPDGERPADPAVERAKARRDSARWSAVVGFGLMFGASFHSGFLFGGVAMVLYGASASVYWSWRLRKLLGDPWAYDPELDGPSAPDWSRK